MKTVELFETAVAKFSVEHQTGIAKRSHEMTIDKIHDSILFSYAEKRRIAKLEPEQTLTFQRSNLERGRILIRVTRKS